MLDIIVKIREDDSNGFQKGRLMIFLSNVFCTCIKYYSVLDINSSTELNLAFSVVAGSVRGEARSY